MADPSVTVKLTAELGPGMAFALGWQVVESRELRDGCVLQLADRRVVIVGHRPWSLEEYGEQARRIVRRGLAPWLDYVGEEVGPPPFSTFTGAELLERVRAYAAFRPRWVVGLEDS